MGLPFSDYSLVVGKKDCPWNTIYCDGHVFGYFLKDEGPHIECDSPIPLTKKNGRIYGPDDGFSISLDVLER